MASAHPFLLGNLYLGSGQDGLAAEQYATVLGSVGFVDTVWVNEALQKGRNPDGGQEYLDTLIADKVANLPEDQRFNVWLSLVTWYPLLGHLERYFDIIQSLDLTSSTWTDADWLVYVGTIAREDTGFTAHRDYIKVADAIGLLGVWDQRGPPDFCHKEDGNWVCE